jgi:hypothetical protein
MRDARAPRDSSADVAPAANTGKFLVPAPWKKAKSWSQVFVHIFGILIAVANSVLYFFTGTHVPVIPWVQASKGFSAALL